jgi:hypothetical protein
MTIQTTNTPLLDMPEGQLSEARDALFTAAPEKRRSLTIAFIKALDREIEARDPRNPPKVESGLFDTLACMAEKKGFLTLNTKFLRTGDGALHAFEKAAQKFPEAAVQWLASPVGSVYEDISTRAGIGKEQALRIAKTIRPAVNIRDKGLSMGSMDL